MTTAPRMTRAEAEATAREIVRLARAATVTAPELWTATRIRLPSATRDRILEHRAHITSVLPVGWVIDGWRGNDTLLIGRRFM